MYIRKDDYVYTYWHLRPNREDVTDYCGGCDGISWKT